MKHRPLRAAAPLIILILLGPIVEASAFRAGAAALTAAISGIYGIKAPAVRLQPTGRGHSDTSLSARQTVCSGTAGLLRADIRMSGTGPRLRTDRSVPRELQEFVGRLSGMQLVIIVLLIIIPVSILTPLLAMLLIGGRCDKCGRYRAMRVTDREKTGYDESLGPDRHPIYRSSLTRVCRYCLRRAVGRRAEKPPQGQHRRILNRPKAQPPAPDHISHRMSPSCRNAAPERLFFGFYVQKSGFLHIFAFRLNI